jgi:hypothetical protein
LASLLGCIACGPEREQGTQRQHREPIELSEFGSIFTLATTLNDERGPEARYREQASLASGGLRTPWLANDQPQVTDNGTRLGGTCGVTFISPSYAVTAAHCVDGELDALTVDMFRPTLELNESYLQVTELGGTFPDYTHNFIGADEGYFVDRYDCTVAVHCGASYGDALNCADAQHTSYDIALLHCAGRPGDVYGFLELASEDDIDAPLLMPWKHEIYDVPIDVQDERYAHYTELVGDVAENYHYHMANSEGELNHQLFPLLSVPFEDGRPPSKLALGSYVQTDLTGCHGTSGSGALQQGRFGYWQLLGPAVFGDGELGSYLCNHAPPINGELHAPGVAGIAYGGLAQAQYVFEQMRSEIEADCTALPDGAATLFTHSSCRIANLSQGSADFVAGLAAPSASSVVDPKAEPALVVVTDRSLGFSGFSAVAGEYRLGLNAWPQTACAAEVCPVLSVSVNGSELFEHEFSEQPTNAMPLGSSIMLDQTGPVSLTFAASGGAIEVGALSLVPVSHTNSFDSALERLAASMQDMAGPLEFGHPARFVGDGAQGFEVRLLSDERLLLRRAALLRGQRWSLAFTLGGAGELECGLLDASGNSVLSADCSLGSATLLDSAPGVESFAGLYIHNAGGNDVLLDDLSLNSVPAFDSDDDGIPDALDDCPTGGLPEVGLLEASLPGSSQAETCLPEATLVQVPTLDLDTLSGCQLEVTGGLLSEVNALDVVPLAVNVDPDTPELMLPLGQHVVSWQVQAQDGSLLEVPQTLELSHLVGEQCCPEGLTLEVGTAQAENLLFDSGGVCALMDAGDDLVRGSRAADFIWGAEGDDYLSTAGGDDILLGGPGADYLNTGGGAVTLFAGEGSDVVHASHASSAKILAGPGQDEIVGSAGNDWIQVGAETLWVLAEAGDDDIVVYDACELSSGLRLDGGAGMDTLVVPISEAEVAALGVTLEGFEEVIVDASHAYLSDCFARGVL